MKCDVCGEEAQYALSIQVNVIDMDSGHEKIKTVWIRLCAECEANNRKFLQRDVGQKKRLADAFTDVSHVGGWN